MCGNLQHIGITEGLEVHHPTKPIDEGRRDRLLCEPLGPEDGAVYGIEQQARTRLLSVLLVAAAPPHVEDTKATFREEFEPSDGVRALS